MHHWVLAARGPKLSVSRKAALRGPLSMDPHCIPQKGDSLGFALQRVSLPSGEVSFIDEGAGPPLLLVHGAPLTGLGFFRVIRALRSTHRTLAPDLPGFGQSTAAASFDGTLSDYARSLEQFCTALDLRNVTLACFDAGGCIGLVAASLVRHRISKLVLLDTVRLPLRGRAWPVKLMLRYVVSSALVRFLNRRFNLFPRLITKLDPIRNPLSPQERMALVSQYDTAQKRDRLIEVFSSMARDDGFMADAAEAASQLADKPLLLVYGQFDPMRLIGSIDWFGKVFSRSTVALLPKERHFPILAAGAEVADIIRRWDASTRLAEHAALLDPPTRHANGVSAVNDQRTPREPA